MNTTENSSSTGGWLGALEKAAGVSSTSDLWDLPEKLSDPFLSLNDRLLATLETFRFSTDARSLIDWAIAQTGMNDPLSHYTRHELEQAFPRFARDRDQHLRTLVVSFKQRGELSYIKDLTAKIKHPVAKQTMQSIIRSL